MNHINPIIQYITQHDKFIDNIKRTYNARDEKSKFENYLKPIYLEMLKCLYSIFKGKNGSDKDIIKHLSQLPCALIAFESQIVDAFFVNRSDKVSLESKKERENTRRHELLEEIILEYNRRKELLSQCNFDEDELKRNLIRDCMKYIIHRILKRITYIYETKSKLNSIDLKEYVKKKRGVERKKKFINSLFDMIDKCCINLIHLTLKEALPLVHDIRMVLKRVLSNDKMYDNTPLLEETDDINEVDTETLQNESFLYTWFLVMFSMFMIKSAATVNEERESLIQQYINIANAKANEYTNDKNRIKFLQNRIENIQKNIKNYKMKYEWERLKKNRIIHKIYRKKVRDDNEEYKTHFEAAAMSFVPRLLKARLDVRLLFKLLAETDIDPSDPKYHEKIQLEKEEREQEEAEKGKKDKKKKDEEIDHITIIRETHRHCNDKAFDLYAGIDAILANLMAQSNRSKYLQRDIKVAMKNYIKETRKGLRLAPYKLAARNKLLYTIQYHPHLPSNLRSTMCQEIRSLNRLSRYLKRFRRTFKRFRKCHEGEEMSTFPPLTEVVWKKWEKRAYKKRFKLPYRVKGKLLPTSNFWYVQEPKVKRAKTRSQKHKEQRVSNEGKSERNNDNNEAQEEEDFKDAEESKKKEPGVWTGKYYKKVLEDYKKKPDLHKSKKQLMLQKKLDLEALHLTKISVNKEKTNITSYIKNLFECNKHYQLKQYLKRRKEQQQFCNDHDFNKNTQMECENQVPEIYLTHEIETARRRRTLKKINDLIIAKRRKATVNNEASSNEEIENLKH